MAISPPFRDREPVSGEPLDVRFLARSHGYELALIVPRREPPAEPLVRLRFLGAAAEVILTLADLEALAVHVKRLQAYVQEERACRQPP